MPLQHPFPSVRHQQQVIGGGSIVRDASSEVQENLLRTRDNLNDTVQKLVEHAAQVQSKIEIEMESLLRGMFVSTTH